LLQLQKQTDKKMSAKFNVLKLGTRLVLKLLFGEAVVWQQQKWALLIPTCTRLLERPVSCNAGLKQFKGLTACRDTTKLDQKVSTTSEDPHHSI
jgi:hypothetical protein